MPSPSEQTPPRCVLCGMNCPVGAELDRTGRVRTLFPADLGVAQGACVLAVTATRLLSSEDRIYQARVSGETADCDRGLDALMARLSGVEPHEVAFLLDLNRPLEGIAAAAALRDQPLAGARLAAFIPPQDGPVAATGVGGCPPYSEIPGSSLILAVGDPCSTHPAIAGPLRDMQRAARGNRLVCVDTAPGRTSRAADETVFVPPDGLAAFLCAVALECGSQAVREALGGLDAEGICRQVGLDASVVARLARSVQDAKALGVVVSHGLGRYGRAEAVLAAAHELARAQSGKLWPLALCANSPALPGLAERLGLETLGSVLEAVEGGQIKVLVVVGWDPPAVLPRRIWSGWRERCEAIAWAGSVESEFAACADVVLPLAFAWEESGRRFDPQGGWQELRPWLPAPAGVLTCEEFVRRLGGKLGVGSLAPADLSGLTAPPAEKLAVGAWVGPDVLDVRRAGEAEAMLVGAAEPQGYTGGLSTACVGWQRRMNSEERVLLSPALARALGREEASGTLLVEASQGEAQILTAPGRVAERAGAEPPLEGSLLAVPAHWEGLRELLYWRGADGWTPAADPCPVRVRLLETAAASAAG